MEKEMIKSKTYDIKTLKGKNRQKAMILKVTREKRQITI